MKLKDFKIGKKFWMSGKQYVCADVGTRSIIAVPYDVGEMIPLILSSYNKKTGKTIKRKVIEKQTHKSFKILFPDGLKNIVIYHYDFPACQQTKTKFQKELEKERLAYEMANNRN